MRHALAIAMLVSLLPTCEAATSDPASDKTESLNCTDKHRIFPLPDAGKVLRFGAEKKASWLELEELGQEVILVDIKDSTSYHLRQPQRYGTHWVEIPPDSELVVRRVESGNAPGSVHVSRHCEVSGEMRLRLSWLQRANALSLRLDKPEPLAPLIAEIDRLIADRVDEKAHALALHMRAQALGVNSRSVEAAAAYAIAERAWLNLNDTNRALGAHVGYGEELYKASDYESALALTPAIPAAELSFFSARQQNLRCASLNELGRAGEADRCYQWVIEAYDKLDEKPELASALQVYASVQINLGNPEAADKSVQRALSLASGPYAPMVRGRLRLMLADISLRRGLVAESLSQSDRALSEFENAKDDRLRWQANVYLHIASLYTQVGAHEEAYAALDEALKRLSARDAPSRIAAASSNFADLERETDHPASALLWQYSAERIYSNLGKTIARDSARAARLRLQLAQGDIDEVAQALAAQTEIPRAHASSWALLEAELRIRQDSLPDARAGLDQLRNQSMSLHNQLRLADLEARYWSRAGDANRAQQTLFESAQHIQALAARADNPVLRYVIARQKLPLRRLAFRILLEELPSPIVSSSAAAGSSASAVWNWLTLGTVTDERARSANKPVARAEKFDKAVAAELLANTFVAKLSPEEPAAQRELISLLSVSDPQSNDLSSTLTRISLAQMQQRLETNAVLLGYVNGKTKAALLWVTRDAAVLLDTTAPDRIKATIATLRAQLNSSSTPVTDIQRTAQQLSMQLLQAAPQSEPPQRLYILADETLDGVAWSALPWPGKQQPLVETTTVSQLRLYTGQQSSTSVEGHPLRVIVASQQSGTSSLPSLTNASAEPHMIQQVVSGRPLMIVQDAAATRDDVLSALDEPGAWVHIAAHGIAQPNRIGYAGFWLEPAQGDTQPVFVSWLDILQNGIRADLVVLNACALANGGTAINGNLSFAAAAARAGAKQVIAAAWPISDSATAVWVPAFYSALTADPNSGAAEALRAAQLRLRVTRMFSHPFFWASLQAIDTK